MTITATTDHDVVAAAAELVPLLRERAAETDETRRVSEDTFAQLRDARLFDILKPAAFGGLELHDHAHAEVAMTLATGCASTAWIFTILNSDNTAILAFPEQVHQEIWGENRHATLAGNLNINPKAVAERVHGGYRLTGQWGFCSGSDFSEWLIFNAPLGDEGAMFLVPRADAQMIDDWFPTGMRGSGSRSMSVRNVFVPEHRVLPVSGIAAGIAKSRELYPDFDGLYSDWPPHSRFPFSSVAVGAALGAVEHFAGTVGSSTRTASALGGRVSLADQDYVATEFAAAAGEAEMARLLIENSTRASAARAHAHETTAPADLARITRDNALVTRASLAAVSRVFSLVGSRAGSAAHPVSRAKRDVEMISHHVSLNWRQNSVRYLASVVA